MPLRVKLNGDWIKRYPITPNPVSDPNDIIIGGEILDRQRADSGKGNISIPLSPP
jgi:hypothetical protein